MSRTPISPGFYDALALPRISLDLEDNPSLQDITSELYRQIEHVIQAPYTFEQLRTASIGHLLQPLQAAISSHNHEGTIAALMILKHGYAFGTSDHKNQGVDEARGFACEILAWRFLNGLDEEERIGELLMEVDKGDPESVDHERVSRDDTERSPLLKRHRPSSSVEDTESTYIFAGLNALEIAVVAEAKQFLSQPAAQGIVDSLWAGRIMFWTSLSINTRKEAQRDHQLVFLVNSYSELARLKTN